MKNSITFIESSLPENSIIIGSFVTGPLQTHTLIINNVLDNLEYD